MTSEQKEVDDAQRRSEPEIPQRVTGARTRSEDLLNRYTKRYIHLWSNARQGQLDSETALDSS